MTQIIVKVEVTADWLKVLTVTSNSRGHYTVLVIAKKNTIILCASCIVCIVNLREQMNPCFGLEFNMSGIFYFLIPDEM